MKPSHGNVATLAVLVGPVTALFIGGAAPVRADEPCAELKLSGATVLELPCPERLGRLLDSPPVKRRPENGGVAAIDPDMAIERDWPHDEAMVAERDWPHDQAMVIPRADKRRKAVPLIEDLLGLFGGHLSRHSPGQPPPIPNPRRAGYGAAAD